MKLKVLVSAPYLIPVLDRFRPLFDEYEIELLVPEVNERMEEEELLGWVSDIDGAVCGDDRYTERVLKSAPRLKVISKWGTGIDSIDQEAAAQLGIKVCNTPNAFTDPVSDTVMGYVLAFARKLSWMDCDIKSGVWVKRPGVSLVESCLGMIGLGNVGKAVAKRARAFGMRILATDPLEMPPDFLAETGVEMVGIDKLLSEADFVSVNCTLSSSSFHILSTEAFRKMKDSAYVINTARGSLIDEPALVEALGVGQIAGAALDVFEDEPLPFDSPLRKMDNVMLAPHNSNSSPVAWERVHQSTIRNLMDVLNPAKTDAHPSE